MARPEDEIRPDSVAYLVRHMRRDSRLWRAAASNASHRHVSGRGLREKNRRAGGLTARQARCRLNHMSARAKTIGSEMMPPGEHHGQSRASQRGRAERGAEPVKALPAAPAAHLRER